FDSHRARVSRLGGRRCTRAELLAVLREASRRDDGGEGLFVLAEPTASVLTARLYERLFAHLPRAPGVPFSATQTGAAQARARPPFGRPFAAVDELRAARCVVSIGCDLLSPLFGDLRSARELVEARQGRGAGLWCVESSLTVTGMFADRRLRVRPSRIA